MAFSVIGGAPVDGRALDDRLDARVTLGALEFREALLGRGAFRIPLAHEERLAVVSRLWRNPQF